MKPRIITGLAAVLAIALFAAVAHKRPYAPPSDLRDAVADASALDALRSAGPVDAPPPAPAAAPRPVDNQFPAAVAPVFDKDVPPELQRQLGQDLAFVGSLTGKKTSPLHGQIFGQMGGPSYLRFFASHIKMVGLYDWDKKPVVACVIPSIEPSKMWLSDSYIKVNQPQIARIMTVFHESRHADPENENWRHVNCPEPFRDANGKDIVSILTGVPLAGKRGCDESELGSYGASLIMLKNIQRYCTNCTEKVRMDAGIYADDQLYRIVDSKARNAIRDDIYK
ncbi:MAG: hypothetical protein NDI60_00725 [Elusimicrobiales bacterium]|nr:hypothetical protein [Elusimicrobiales bacterium]